MYKVIGLLTISFLPSILPAQQPAKDSANNSSDSAWSFSADSYYYLVPGGKNTLNLNVYADHKALHTEMRYNYEDRNTASIFGGWKFETGNKVKLQATPMIGIAFGNTSGFAPALEVELTYKIFDFYLESEYFVDFTGKKNDFLYTWTELGVSPCEAFRIGLTTESTRLYKTKLDIPRGFFGAYSFWKLTLGTYYFNPFSKRNYIVASCSIDF
jgi:hypothetical protein